MTDKLIAKMPKNILKKGVLIAIEGIDGSGKSTQAKRLVSFLKESGYDAVYLLEPTYGKWGKKIRDMAKRGKREKSPEDEYRLFVLDRKENVKENLLPALKAKKIVVLDRYYFSTMAYQGALGIDPQKIRDENEAFAPIPDLTILLTIPVPQGIARIKENRGDFTAFEGSEYLEQVKSIFEDFVSPKKNVVTIDGAMDEDDVFLKIKDSVIKILVPLGSGVKN